LRKRIEQGDINVLSDRSVGIEFHHNDPVLIAVVQMGNASKDHVIVVEKSETYRTARVCMHLHPIILNHP